MDWGKRWAGARYKRLESRSPLRRRVWERPEGKREKREREGRQCTLASSICWEDRCALPTNSDPARSTNTRRAAAAGRPPVGGDEDEEEEEDDVGDGGAGAADRGVRWMVMTAWERLLEVLRRVAATARRAAVGEREERERREG